MCEKVFFCINRKWKRVSQRCGAKIKAQVQVLNVSIFINVNVSGM